MNYVKPAAIAATALSLTAASATAGGMAEPIMTMEPAMVMEESASSSSGLLIPLILIALIAIALDGSDAVGNGAPTALTNF